MVCTLISFILLEPRGLSIEYLFELIVALFTTLITGRWNEANNPFGLVLGMLFSAFFFREGDFRIFFEEEDLVEGRNVTGGRSIEGVDVFVSFQAF